MYGSNKYHQSSSNLYELDCDIMKHGHINKKTEVKGYIDIDGEPGTNYYTWLSEGKLDDDDNDIMGMFVFSCEVHMLLCDMLKCHCICTKLLLNDIKSK